MSKQDLIVLVADLDAEETIKALLQRHQSLEIRPITYEVNRHPQRDAGCYNEAHIFLQSQARYFRKALVIFDHHGSGHENETTEAIQTQIERQMASNGWGEADVCVIVLHPELEIWVWSTPPEVDRILKWSEKKPPVRDWLKNETEYWNSEDLKPHAPKEALQAALRQVKTHFSARIFADLGTNVSTRQCQDSSFLRLKTVLQTWFPND